MDLLYPNRFKMFKGSMNMLFIFTIWKLFVLIRFKSVSTFMLLFPI